MTVPVTYNRPPLVRGDTLTGWSVEVQIGGAPQLIESARLHLRTRYGRLQHDWPAVVDGSTVIFADVPPSITSQFAVETLVFDLELTLPGGRVFTWLAGEQPVLADRTY